MPHMLVVKTSRGFRRFLRNHRQINETQEFLEGELVNVWNSYYVQEVRQSEDVLQDRIELLKTAAISVKHYLERKFSPDKQDYGISCACLLLEPFELHIDITPKHKRCLANIASIYLH